MSKVSIEFDTETKELTVSMDGSSIEHVRDICFYKNYDEKGFAMGIAQVKKNDNGTKTWTQTSAEVSVASLTERPDQDPVSVISKMFSKK